MQSSDRQWVAEICGTMARHLGISIVARVSKAEASSYHSGNPASTRWVEFNSVESKRLRSSYESFLVSYRKRSGSHLSYKECFGQRWTNSLAHRTSKELQTLTYHTRGSTDFSIQASRSYRPFVSLFHPKLSLLSASPYFLSGAFAGAFAGAFGACDCLAAGAFGFGGAPFCWVLAGVGLEGDALGCGALGC